MEYFFSFFLYLSPAIFLFSRRLDNAANLRNTTFA